MRATHHTSLGDIALGLDPEGAPLTVASSVRHARAGLGDGALFHRVPGPVVQAGGYGPGLAPRRDDGALLPDEADSGLSGLTGTAAMARTREPHSATTRFFLNLADNAFLDHRERTPEGRGYRVLGRAAGGMDAVARIGDQPAGDRAGHRDVPPADVVLERVTVAEHDSA